MTRKAKTLLQAEKKLEQIEAQTTVVQHTVVWHDSERDAGKAWWQYVDYGRGDEVVCVREDVALDLVKQPSTILVNYVDVAPVYFRGK